MGNRKRQIIVGEMGNQGGFTQAATFPLQYTYDPTTTDQCDYLGQTWINSVDSTAWTAVNDIGTTTWISTAGGSGTFTNLTLTGTTITTLNIPNGGATIGNGLTVAGTTTLTTIGARKALTTNSSNVLTGTTLTQGDWLIGNASSVPALGTITSPNGTIAIGYSSPNVTVDVVAGGYIYPTYASSPITGSAQNFYIIPSGSGTVTLNLPASPSAVGQTIGVCYASVTNTDILIVTALGSTTPKILRPNPIVGSTQITAENTFTFPACNLQQYPTVWLVCVNATANSANWLITGITTGITTS